MNSGRISLEDFTVPQTLSALPAPEPSIDVAALQAAAEASRVESYETGYKTGWDDAVRAAEDERRNIGEELARNLRDASFTYFEAREELLVGLRAFLRDLLDAVFPTLMPEASASALADALGDMAEDAGPNAIEISVSPEDVETVRALLPMSGTDLNVSEEPALAPGQAQLRSATREASIDVERVVKMLRDVIDPTRPSRKEATNG